MSVINPVFSKAIYSNQLDIDTKKIVSMIGTPRKSYNIESVVANKKDLYVLEDLKFKFLKDIILKELYSYASDGMRYTNEFKITTSWFTRVDKNESSQSHNHNNCFISGVLYLQTYEDCGNIVFEDFSDGRFELEVNEYNILNSKQWVYEPTDGLILLFPSDARHKVEENKSEHKRYSLAFNCMPIGLLGDEGGDSHLYFKNES